MGGGRGAPRPHPLHIIARFYACVGLIWGLCGAFKTPGDGLTPPAAGLRGAGGKTFCGRQHRVRYGLERILELAVEGFGTGVARQLLGGGDTAHGPVKGLGFDGGMG